jgi:hypothetical protein
MFVVSTVLRRARIAGYLALAWAAFAPAGFT